MDSERHAPSIYRKSQSQKIGCMFFFNSMIDRLIQWVNVSPDAVILQNTKMKSGHTHTIYMDQEFEGKLTGCGSFIGEDEMGKEK